VVIQNELVFAKNEKDVIQKKLNVTKREKRAILGKLIAEKDEKINIQEALNVTIQEKNNIIVELVASKEKNKELEIDLPEKKYQNALEIVKHNPKRISDLFPFIDTIIIKKYPCCLIKKVKINITEVAKCIRIEIEKRNTVFAIDKSLRLYYKVHPSRKYLSQTILPKKY